MEVKGIDPNCPEMVALKSGETLLNKLKKQKRERQDHFDEMQARFVENISLPKEQRLQLEAAALLADEPVENLTRDDLERGAREIEVITTAIKAQERIVGIARAKVSRLLHAVNRSEYVKVEKRIAAAVAELAQANEAESRFFDALRDAGCTAIQFRSMRIGAVGLASDTQSGAAFHRIELREHCPEAAA